MTDTAYEEALALLSCSGQQHLLRFYEELTDTEKENLLNQIRETDFSYPARFPEKDRPLSRGRITPLAAMELSEIRKHAGTYSEKGLDALRDGRVAAVLLAGGMGTRLGTNGPKGCFDIGITKPVYIFQRLVENLLLRVRECGRPIHLFVMTSDINDEATRLFFREHDNFGYDGNYLHFFRQEMAPAVDNHGHVLLDRKDALAASPNGNGGWFRSLDRAGYTELLTREGIGYLNVFAVDNVLQNICDPVFIGAVIENGCVSGSKVVRKSSAEEKVGVMCLEDGRPSVIEYYEMTDEMLHAEDDRGERLYNFGVILNYLFRVPDLIRVMDADLPVHFANKKIPYIAEDGSRVLPDEPNGWKFEYFIFDILKELGSCLPFEVERNREFAPVKNAKGADSVETARALCLENGIDL